LHEETQPNCYFTAVAASINRSSIRAKDAAYTHYLTAVAGKSNNEARLIAKDVLGDDVFWDWDRKKSSASTKVVIHALLLLVPRTREGYYHYTGGIEVRCPIFMFS
jgi:isocitrate lyase